MNLLPTMSTVFALLLLLVAFCCGAPTTETQTSTSNYTSAVTILTSPITTYNITTAAPTTKPITTVPFTTAQTTMNDSTRVTTGITSMNTSSAANVTTLPTTTNQSSTTSRPSRRKFDSLSFIGGMILALGLSALIFLVISYLRRGSPAPYSNLR